MKKLVYYFLALIVVICKSFAAMIRPDVTVEELKEQFTNEHSKFMKINGMDVHYQERMRSNIY